MTLSSEPSVTVSTVPSSSPTISPTVSLTASPSPAPTQCSSDNDCADNFFCAGRMQCVEAICQCVETPPPTSKAPSPNPTTTSSNPPSEAISAAPSKAVTAPPVAAPACTDVVISIATDTWPEETTWYLVDASGVQVTADGPYSSRQTAYNTELCLSDDTYTFTIDDSYGDGIYGEGYSILVDGNVIATGNNFGSQAVETFIIQNGGGGGGTLAPTISPTSACQCSDYDPSSEGWPSDFWYDRDGPFYDCAWYSQGTRCAEFGNSYANFGGETANSACCACGGGKCVL